MAENVFYATKNRGNTRAITIKGPKLLPGRAPSNVKKIAIPVIMQLSNQKTTGQPEWIANAHAFVAKNGGTVADPVKFDGYDIDFATENRNLFAEGRISAPRCSMRGFSVHGQGSSEEPEIVLSFTIYAPFSTALWEYLGQVASDEIWTKFVQSTAPAEDDDQEDLDLDDEETDEATDEDTDFDDEGEDEGTDEDSDEDSDDDDE